VEVYGLGLEERNGLEDAHRTVYENDRQQNLLYEVVVDQETVFATFAQKDLDYWLQGSRKEGGCETRYVGASQEAEVASVLPSVMNEKSIRYWYQSGGVSGVEARVVHVINDQRNYEGGFLAVVRQRVSINYCASGSKMRLY
jgi:hypothetical protein